MKKIVIIVLAFFLCACSTVESLKKPQTSQTLTIKDTYTQTGEGLFGVKKIDGIVAGTYTSIGENEKGTFFSMNEECVFTLLGKNADFYLKNSKIPQGKEKHGTYQIMRAGGIFIPKDKSKQNIQIFFITPAASGGTTFIPPLDLLLILTSISTKDKISFINIESQEFIKSINVASTM